MPLQCLYETRHRIGETKHSSRKTVASLMHTHITSVTLQRGSTVVRVLVFLYFLLDKCGLQNTVWYKAQPTLCPLVRAGLTSFSTLSELWVWCLSPLRLSSFLCTCGSLKPYLFIRKATYPTFHSKLVCLVMAQHGGCQFFCSPIFVPTTSQHEPYPDMGDLCAYSALLGIILSPLFPI